MFDLESLITKDLWVKITSKKFDCLAAKAVLPFFASKIIIFDKKKTPRYILQFSLAPKRIYVFQAEITFLAGNNWPDAHHSQGSMKFATQISPLLNYYCLNKYYFINVQWKQNIDIFLIRMKRNVSFSKNLR